LKIAVNTGGGDAPGLNAVIRAVVCSASNRGWEVYGISRGYQGILEGTGSLTRLNEESVSGITHQGGSILGTTNRGNPLEWPVTQADGSVTVIDRSDEVVNRLRNLDIDALIAIGGDGSLHIAARLAEKGLPVVGVPKTIDNDLAATQVTFGFHTAVETATEAIGRLHSTAEAHRRVMVVELMGRDTGWIALFAGVAGTADVILIPEIPYDMEIVCEKINKRYESGPEFAIVVAAEGAFEQGSEPLYKAAKKPGQASRLGGIAELLAQRINERTGHETRSLVLGHLQRGGSPIAYDRLLALRFGAAAVQLVAEGHFGCMVALNPPEVEGVPFVKALSRKKTVPVGGDVVTTARALGVSFGDSHP
jgi:ATP-dependent phosphofructokinase / diphosphate-dependent phosphofructokinase